MASSSSSIGNASTRKYDVFINHRGKDVKNSLASTIYHILDLRGVRVFLDREELEAGEKISDAIEEAISDALVHIAILSPNYAQSRWCLEELTQMLRTGKKIIPIFYKVKPSDLRWVGQGKGVYSKEFSKHEKSGRYQPEKLKEWKKALSEVSYSSGYELNKPEHEEGVVVKEIAIIVNKVVKDQNMVLLDVATHPVGLDEAIKEFQNFVETSRKNVKTIVGIVGIVGLGGCGKTTLVKQYFNNKGSSYPRSSFLFDVREAAANNRLHDLQKKLLDDLVPMHNEKAIHHPSQGKGLLEHHVQSVKALIILDDVDHKDQIETLLPLKKDNLLPESLIIVTTRDIDVIESSAALPSVSVFLYKKRGLDPDRAKELFCRHAFKRETPVNGFEDLVEEFLKACQGLPLSLKVLGGQLYRRNEDYWKSQLHKISKTLPDDITHRLKVSYDALDEAQQELFLDIACFFIGELKDMAISIWDGLGGEGRGWLDFQIVENDFQILENKCLVEVDDENRIRIHDHLRDLGRQIAIKKTPSRFWSRSQFESPLEERLPMRGIMAATGSMRHGFGYCNSHYESTFEECKQLLMGHSTSWSRRLVESPLDERLLMRGIMAATGSMRHGFGYCNSHYEPPFEECMQLLMGHSTSRSRRLTSSPLGLQLLAVRGNSFKEQYGKLSEELVWVRWYEFPYENIPSWLSTRKLRVLELYWAERLTELWGPNDAPPSQLRELIIPHCNLKMIPETIGLLEHLKKIVLNIRYGMNEIGISSLPEEFCCLKSLEHLELLNFSYLSSLPTHFGNLTRLKYINFSGCQELTALPVSFNQLTELQYLYLSRTGLRELPADIGRLAKLEVLEIGGCRLTSLPASLGNLSSLVRLKIEDCRELKYFPSMENLSCLIQLRISDCGELTYLPPVKCLTRLENLELISSGVEYLPEGFGQLVNLQKLYISHCLIRVLRLANPEERYSKKRWLLNDVDSSMFKFSRLKSIDLVETKVSTLLVSEDCCPSLEYLRLQGNHDLMEIETLPTTLKSLCIWKCVKLKNVRCFAGLAKLHYLKISYCPRWDELPSFTGLVELQSLRVEGCPIRGFRLANQEDLYSKKHRRYCKKPRLLNPTNSSMFKFIRLNCKPRLLDRMDSSVFKCPRLKSIDLTGVRLKSILLTGTRLKSLWLSGSTVSTISISQDCCLEDLSLYGNSGLMEIQTLPTTLKSVVIIGCQKLTNIRCVADLLELRHLNIQQCPELDEVPSLACCTCLEVLKIDVSRITKIEGKLKNLDKLDRLQIRRCIPPNIPRRPCRMEIVGRTVEDVESIVDSLSFPNFTVVNEVHRSGVRKCEMKARLSNASCVIACFVLSCHVDGSLSIELELHDDYGGRGMGLLEGKQVYVVVRPFDLNDDFMEGTDTTFLKFTLMQPGSGSIELDKGMAVIVRKEEEEKASAVLNRFLELLGP